MGVVTGQGFEFFWRISISRLSITIPLLRVLSVSNKLGVSGEWAVKMAWDANYLVIWVVNRNFTAETPLPAVRKEERREVIPSIWIIEITPQRPLRFRGEPGFNGGVY
jgi:hypothetical protein